LIIASDHDLFLYHETASTEARSITQKSFSETAGTHFPLSEMNQSDSELFERL